MQGWVVIFCFWVLGNFPGKISKTEKKLLFFDSKKRKNMP